MVQRLIGHQPLQPRVLLLQLLEPLRLIQPQAALLPPPAVVGLLGDAEPSCHFGHTLALRQDHLRLPQFPDDLLCRVPLPRQADSLLPARILA